MAQGTVGGTYTFVRGHTILSYDLINPRAYVCANVLQQRIFKSTVIITSCFGNSFYQDKAGELQKSVTALQPKLTLF